MNWKKGCGLYCILCVFITIIIVISVCVDTIEPTEYGIKYNSVSKKIDDENIFDNGWYFLGPTVSFQTFPKTQVNLDFNEFKGSAAAPLQVKDNIGQEIKFLFSIQYKLHKESLGKLYNYLKLDYERTFIQKIDFSVREKIGLWSEDAFWADRSGNTELLRKAINETLQELYADCVGLQVIQIKFSATKEAALVATQVTNQRTKTKDQEQKVKEELATIKAEEAKFEKDIKGIRAEVTAKALEIKGNARTKAQEGVLKARNAAYQTIEDKTKVADGGGAGNEDGMITQGLLGQYLLYTELQERDDLNMLFNVKSTITDMRSSKVNSFT